MTPSEERPHIVFREGVENTTYFFENYFKAWEFWKDVSTWQEPWKIATIVRVCTPEKPVVDVSE